jgi:hypothetical protein
LAEQEKKKKKQPEKPLIKTKGLVKGGGESLVKIFYY